MRTKFGCAVSASLALYAVDKNSDGKLKLQELIKMQLAARERLSEEQQSAEEEHQLSN